MFREPWFRIIDVTESKGRSLADIAKDVASEFGYEVSDLRGARRMHRLSAARREVYRRVKIERPDITSTQLGIYMRKEGSTIRHAWLAMEAA